MTERKFKPRKLIHPYRAPKGFVLPKPGDVKPGTVKDRRQLDLFEAVKRLAGDYVQAPLAPDLALQLLEKQADRLSPDECGVLRLIGRGHTLSADDRQILNGVFSKLGAAAMSDPSRLRKLLLMLSSPYAGEVATAAKAIGSLLESQGSDWHTLG